MLALSCQFSAFCKNLSLPVAQDGVLRPGRRPGFLTAPDGKGILTSHPIGAVLLTGPVRIKRPPRLLCNLGGRLLHQPSVV